jgi:hypothetical protein
MENNEFYHDRCIAATLSKFLLQESKFLLAPPKSLCYSRTQVGVSCRPPPNSPLRSKKKISQPQQLKPKG